MKKMIQQALRPLQNRIMMMIARGVINAVQDDDGMQLMKSTFLKGETKDGHENFQNFGFTSNPPVGTECVAVFPAGNRDHGLIIATNNRQFRLINLASGETALYTDDGTKIHLKKGGVIDVVTAVKVNITAPDVEMSGNLKVNGNLVVIGTSLLTGAVTMANTLLVQLTTTVNGLLSALGYSGLLGGPVTSTVDMTTTGNVTGGGTSLASIKTTYNSHTHPETGVTTNAPNESL